MKSSSSFPVGKRFCTKLCYWDRLTLCTRTRRTSRQFAKESRSERSLPPSWAPEQAYMYSDRRRCDRARVMLRGAPAAAPHTCVNVCIVISDGNCTAIVSGSTSKMPGLLQSQGAEDLLSRCWMLSCDFIVFIRCWRWVQKIAQILTIVFFPNILRLLHVIRFGVTSKVRTLTKHNIFHLCKKVNPLLPTETKYDHTRTYLHYEAHQTQLLVIVDQSGRDISEGSWSLKIFVTKLCRMFKSSPPTFKSASWRARENLTSFKNILMMECHEISKAHEKKETFVSTKTHENYTHEIWHFLMIVFSWDSHENLMRI